MKKRRALVFVALLSLTIGCDHATKAAATALLESDSVVSLAGGAVRLELAHNPGAMLSLGADLPAAVRIPVLLVLVPLALLAAALVALRSTSSRTLSLFAGALLAGGGLSNWIDRLVHDGLVIDFVSLGIGPVRTGIFNVADVAVVMGALLLVAARPVAHDIAKEDRR
jgi:signal peptidase II